MGPKESICELLINYSIFYNPIPNDKVIEAYVNKLYEDGFTPAQVKYVLDETIKNNVFFPKICDFHKAFTHESSSDDHANELAGKIISAISDYGPYQTGTVKQSVGDLGWHAIESFGGWHMLCEITNDQIPTVRAQLRDLCKSLVKKDIVIRAQKQIGNSSNNLQRLTFDV